MNDPMNSLDAQIKRFRSMKNHASGCNSLKPQPEQEGFYYDVHVIMHCDCFLALKDPTFEEQVKFVRHMATRFGGVHTQACNASNPIKEMYRNELVYVTRHCNCWLAEVDKPVPAPYTEPMTQFLILPYDSPATFFDTDRTYPTERAAVKMLIYQGYSDTPQYSDYWGHDYRIISKDQWEAEKLLAHNPVVETLKHEIRKIRANALGPHLDTPIYDQLAREYDKRYNTMNYFETALAQKLKRMGQHNL